MAAHDSQLYNVMAPWFAGASPNAEDESGQTAAQLGETGPLCTLHCSSYIYLHAWLINIMAGPILTNNLLVDGFVAVAVAACFLL